VDEFVVVIMGDEMRVEEADVMGLFARMDLSRRGFVMTSLATGFALSVTPAKATIATKDGLKSEIIAYPQTDHGFNADYRESYNTDAAAGGRKRALAWFNANGVG
jgi:dienelactone hydrolase